MTGLQPSTTCPRCGYDQRGAMTTWEARGSCDLNGTCSECGLRYDWMDLLNPGRRPPAWCFEHCERRRFVRACISTMARSFLPARLWRSIRMEHHIRPQRLAAYILIAFILPLMLLYIAVQTTVAIYVRHHQQAGLIQLRQIYITNLATAQAALRNDPEADVTWRIAQIEGALANPWTVNHSYTSAIAEAIFFPARSLSSGSIAGPFGPELYPAPRNLYHVADFAIYHNLPAGVSYPGWVQQMDASAPFVTLSLGAVLLLLIPLSMALLPISRRRARVRWWHVVRVAVYSAAIVPCVAFATMVLLSVAIVAPTWASLAMQVGIMTAYFGVPIAAFIWWWMAIKHYLRMPRGLLVAGALTGACTLALGVPLAYIDHSYVMFVP